MRDIILQNVPECVSAYVVSQYIKKAVNHNSFLFITNEKKINENASIIKFFNHDINVLKYLKINENHDNTIERNAVLQSILTNTPSKTLCIVTSKNAILDNVPEKNYLLENSKIIEIGKTYQFNELIDTLLLYGYERKDFVLEPGEFSVRGEIIDIYTENSYRIEFFENEVEKIRIFDTTTQKSISSCNKFSIIPVKQKDSKANFLEYIPSETLIIYYKDPDFYFKELENIKNQKIILSKYVENDTDNIFKCNTELQINYSIEKAKELIKNSNKKVLICAFSDISATNIRKIFINEKNAIVSIVPIETSFETENCLFISEKDLFKSQLTPRKYSKKNFLNDLNALTENDYIVHINHGIGQFIKIETLEINKIKHDFLLILYNNNDKLYLPVENINLISRYGSDEHTVQLDTLGSKSWLLRKEKVKKKIKDISKKLLELAALRQNQTSFPVQIDDTYTKFCDKFPYIETEDQAKSIEEIENDLLNGKIMDRLICGDVGFGKTEVAIRAAYLIASQKKQVAVMVPTTILAKQHYESFKNRFESTNIRICQLSRFSKNLKIKTQIENGEFDIIIGTKALLSQNFKDLGMLIIDEEQHFGVSQKEKIKELKSTIHVLTLSATPIPRTLQMSISGIRDLSIINTPPFGKIPTKTYITTFGNEILIKAIKSEIERHGQIFYVCPHISDIDEVKNFIITNIKNAKIIIAHSKLTTTELESAIDDFYSKKYDILLATNIIESGLDISNANTLIVHNSQYFGLASMYQLRGRVGRSNIQSYAYFTVKPNLKLTKQTEKRLNIIKNLDKLGSGFVIASYDMDIRGAGNVLGEEQSGHIKEIGIELYQKMLQESIDELQNSKKITETVTEETKIVLNRNVLIPTMYISDNDTRLDFYRRIANIQNDQEYISVYKEIIDRFGKLPEEVKNLFYTIKLKNIAKKINISKITEIKDAFVIEFIKFDKTIELLNFINKNSNVTYIGNNKIQISKKENLENILLKISNI